MLEHNHQPLQPELEDCTVTMDPADPSSTAAQEQVKAARAAAQASGPSSSTARAAAVEMSKSKNDQIAYLFQATIRIEQGLANLVKN